MRRRCLILLLALLTTYVVWGQNTIRIWDETLLHRQRVTLTPYLPDGKPRAAIIVCPGGSYCWHDMATEGTAVGEWLQRNGIAAFVLKYRVQGVFPYIFHTRLISRGHRHPDMIEDIQRSIQLLRQQAAEYGIEDCMLGAMGFSAGGHLVMSSAELFYNDFLAPHGIMHDVSLRPDFVVPIYPVVSLSEPCTHKRSRRALLGEYRKHNRVLRDSLSLEKHVLKDCPPVFLMNCKDDPIVKYHNSELLDSALTVNGINHRYIQYNTGGHGFGASETKGTAECRQWKQEFLEWLNTLLQK